MTASETWQFIGNLCAAVAILSALKIGVASNSHKTDLSQTLSILGILNFIWIILTDTTGISQLITPYFMRELAEYILIKNFLLGFTHIFVMYEISLFCIFAVFFVKKLNYSNIYLSVILKWVPIFSFSYYLFIQLFLGHFYSYINSQVNFNEVLWIISELAFVIVGFVLLKNYFNRENSTNPTERELKC